MSENLKELNQVELRNKMLELQKKLMEYRFDKYSGKVVDTAASNKMRKEKARILTKINQANKI